MKTKRKAPWVISLIICIIALTVGVSFHGLRMHPENVDAYDFGCTIGSIMAVVAVVAFITYIVLFVRYKKQRNNRRTRQ